MNSHLCTCGHEWIPTGRLECDECSLLVRRLRRFALRFAA